MSTVAFALSMALAFGHRTATPDLACQAGLVSQAWDLLRLAHFGHEEEEHAAFIVRDTNGAYLFVYWRYRHTARRASYEGVVPADAVAIIHNHPNSEPYPSANDIQVAHATGLTVYVVTRLSISRTSGESARTVLVGDWNPALHRAQCR